MSTDSSKSHELDSLLAQLVAKRLCGEAIDVESLETAHPHFGGELRARWADLQRLDAIWALPAGSPTSSAGRSASLLHAGHAFDGFSVIREIGRGGMGVVYLARQQDLGRDIALKVLPAVSGLSPYSRARFVREAQAIAAVSHPNIVHTYKVAESEGFLYIAMEYVEGTALSACLTAIRHCNHGDASTVWDRCIQPGTSQAATSPEVPMRSRSSTADTSRPRLDAGYIRRVCDLIVKAARALHAAHERGVVHRDVKPSNILIDRAGEPRIIDFGLASLSWEPHVTLTGEFFGTPHYASPEQARGRREAIDRRTDVYSLGATLYECLTLSTPFAGESAPEVLTNVIGGALRRPRELNGSLARDVETILQKALEKEPLLRYASAQDFADDIERFLSYRPILAKRSGIVTRLGKSFRRRPLVCATMLVLALLVGTGGFAYRLWHREALRQTEVRLHSLIEQGDINAHCLMMPWLEEQIPEEMSRRKLLAERCFTEVLKESPGHFWARMQRARVRIGLARDKDSILDDLRIASKSLPGCMSPEAYVALVGSGRKLVWDSLQWHSSKPAQSTSAGLVGCSADDSYFLATAAYLEGNRESALNHLNAALRANRNHYWSIVARTRSANSVSDIKSDIDAALAMRPDCIVSYYLRDFQVCDTPQQVAEARSVLETGATLAPNDLIILKALAWFFAYEVKDYQQSLKWAEQAIRIRDTAENRSTAANVLEQCGRLKEALAYVDNALELGAGGRMYVPLLGQKGRILWKLGKRDEAANALEAAIENDPADWYARSALASIEVEKGRINPAISQLRELRRYSEYWYARNGEHVRLAEYLEKVGDTASAERELMDGIELADGLGVTQVLNDRQYLAALQTRLRGPGAGDAVFTSAAEKHKASPMFHSNYAQYLQNTGKTGEAIQEARTAVGLFANRKEAAGARITLAGALEAAGRLREAEVEYGILIEDSPASAHAYQGRARVLRKLGQQDDALRVVEQGIRLCQPDPDLFYELATIQSAKGESVEAVKSLKRSIDIICREPEKCNLQTPGLFDAFASAKLKNGEKDTLVSTCRELRANERLSPYLRLRAALWRARVLWDAEDLANAELAAQEATCIPEQKAADWEGYLLLGKIQFKLGKVVDALVSFKLSTDYAPTVPGEPHLLLLMICRQGERQDLALQVVDGWLKRGFEDSMGFRARIEQPEYEAQYRLMRCLLLTELRRSDEASEELSRVRALFAKTHLDPKKDPFFTEIMRVANQTGQTAISARIQQQLESQRKMSTTSSKPS